jgi:hypothetical protein
VLAILEGILAHPKSFLLGGKMRSVLRDWYVGAVLLGLVLFDFVGDIVKIIENPILMWIQRSVQHSALSAGQPWYNKAALQATLLDAALFLGIAIFLTSWLYGEERAPVPPARTAE